MALEPITRQEQIIAGKDLEPITRMERFLKEYGGGAGGGVSDEQIKNAVEKYLDENPIGVDLSVTGATVGQTVKITAVDDKGVPTAWEPADFPSGGGGEVWELLATVDMVQDATHAKVDLPYPVKKLFVYAPGTGTAATQDGNKPLKIANNAYGYNTGVMAQMKSPGTAWRNLTAYIDFAISSYPVAVSSDDNSTTLVIQSAYNGSMTPTTIYITTHDQTALFNAKTWSVYGVKA